MKFCLMMFFLIFMSELQADPTIYKWVDKQGGTHYSDTPGDQNASVLLLPNSDVKTHATATIPSLSAKPIAPERPPIKSLKYHELN